jgi:acyl transferase domain-containing protein
MLAASLAAQSHGAMLAVGLGLDRILPFFDKLKIDFGQLGVSVGCYNSPKSLTVSGDKIQIEILEKMLHEQQIFARRLQVGVAYHSKHMSEISEEYLQLIKGLEPGENYGSRRPIMVSSVTGQIVNPEQLRKGEYWVKNMVSPVDFSTALSLICSKARLAPLDKIDEERDKMFLIHDLIEIGPHSALRAPVRDILQSIGQESNLEYNSILTRGVTATETALRLVGYLHSAGYPVDISEVNMVRQDASQSPKVLVDLPEYPFDHSKIYWSEPRLSKAFRFRKHPRLDLLGTPVPDWNAYEKRWRHTLKISELPWMEDHKVLFVKVFTYVYLLILNR